MSTAERVHRGFRDPFLTAILAVFVVLSALYQTATPPLEASDEAGHFAFILYLKTHHALPVAHRLSDAFPGHQELVQPPLYYLLGALVAAPTDTRNAGRFFIQRRDAPIGRADIPGPKHMWLPSGDRSFPYKRTMLAIALVRLLSMLMGLGTVVLTYHIARTIKPTDPVTARFAAALVAFNPMFLFISGAINNDNLATMLVTLVLLLVLRGIGEPPDLRRSVRLGVLVGAAALTKVSALILAPVLALGLVGKRIGRQQLGAWFAAGAVAMAIWGWWPLRNRLLYGDWLGLTPHIALGRVGRPEVRPWALLEEWTGFVKSYWGVFGAFNIVFPEPVYHLFYLLTVLGIAGAVCLLLTGRASLRSGVLLLIVVSVTNLLAVAHWTSRVTGSQGRLMFPSIAATAVLFALGAGLPGRRAQNVIAVVVSVFLISTAVYGALVLIPSQYR